jgi:hypothetical protein
VFHNIKHLCFVGNWIEVVFYIYRNDIFLPFVKQIT